MGQEGCCGCIVDADGDWVLDGGVGEGENVDGESGGDIRVNPVAAEDDQSLWGQRGFAAGSEAAIGRDGETEARIGCAALVLARGVGVVGPHVRDRLRGQHVVEHVHEDVRVPRSWRVVVLVQDHDGQRVLRAQTWWPVVLDLNLWSNIS